jgi:hypothetical protein
VANDFLDNYMNNFHDNPFEADGSLHNLRVMRNLMLNSASHAYCNQPTLSGPDLLDPQHRLSPAARLDARRTDGRRLPQQRHPVGDVGAGQQQHALAQQPVHGRELDAASCSR